MMVLWSEFQTTKKLEAENAILKEREDGLNHALKLAEQGLQTVINRLNYDDLIEMFSENPDAEIYGYLEKVRKDAIEAIKIIKGIKD